MLAPSLVSLKVLFRKFANRWFYFKFKHLWKIEIGLLEFVKKYAQKFFLDWQSNQITDILNDDSEAFFRYICKDFGDNKLSVTSIIYTALKTPSLHCLVQITIFEPRIIARRLREAWNCKYFAPKVYLIIIWELQSTGRQMTQAT